MYSEYNNNLMEMQGPHVLGSKTIGYTMRYVVVALIPQFVVSLYMFGARCLPLVLVSILACLFFELLFNLIRKKKQTLKNWSAVVTGIIIAFNMPTGVPYWLTVIAAFISIIIIKQLFGGIGRNYVNPAVSAIVVLNLVFPNIMSVWPVPAVGSPDIPAGAQTAATSLEIMSGAEGVMPSKWELLLGLCSGNMGEISALMLLIGGLFLIWKKVISPIIPASIIGTVIIFSLIARVDPMIEVCSGALMLCAFFMATDPVTSPVKARGMISYGIGIGVITMAIRLYVPGIAEGVYIAILIMNLLSQVSDRIFIEERFKKKKRN